MSNPYVPEGSESTKHYWKSIDEGKFELQRCLNCDEWIFYPRQWCNYCFSSDLEWQQADRFGRIHTYTIVQRTPIDYFAEKTPYVLAIVKLDSGPQMMCNVINCDVGEIEIEDRVKICFEKHDDGTLPQFEPVS